MLIVTFSGRATVRTYLVQGDGLCYAENDIYTLGRSFTAPLVDEAAKLEPFLGNDPMWILVIFQCSHFGLLRCRGLYR